MFLVENNFNDVFKDNEVYILANHFRSGITLGM